MIVCIIGKDENDERRCDVKKRKVNPHDARWIIQPEVCAGWEIAGLCSASWCGIISFILLTLLLLLVYGYSGFDWVQLRCYGEGERYDMLCYAGMLWYVNGTSRVAWV